VLETVAGDIEYRIRRSPHSGLWPGRERVFAGFVLPMLAGRHGPAARRERRPGARGRPPPGRTGHLGKQRANTGRDIVEPAGAAGDAAPRSSAPGREGAEGTCRQARCTRAGKLSRRGLFSRVIPRLRIGSYLDELTASCQHMRKRRTV
jgi:hypothetical protein